MWMQILSVYDTDSTSPTLTSTDVARFLKDSGVNVTNDQLKLWLGNVDDEKDGFDQSELMKIVNVFDDMHSWRGKVKDSLASISGAQFCGFTALGDVIFIIILGVVLGWFLLNSEEMERKLRTSSIVSAMRMSTMKSKWTKKEAEIEDFSLEAANLRSRLAAMEQSQELSMDLTKTMAEEKEADAAELRQQLEEVNKKQEAAESELSRIRKDAQKHMTEAHMSTTKLQAMQKMLRGVDAVGGASPFRGASKGQYCTQGAKAGFAAKGRMGSRSLERGNSDDNKRTVAKGLSLQSFVFGYPTDDDIVFYEVDKSRDLLGEGADCAYKCRDIATKTEYAVKIYEISRFDQRAQIVNDLRAKQAVSDHPNIVRYHNVVETADQIFVMMELIPGKDLFSFIVDRGGLSEPVAAEIFYQVCGALNFCHINGLIHGDVKPENVMIVNDTSQDSKVAAKLIDFGFACFQQEGDACSLGQAVMDTYSAPEAYDHKPSTKETDSFRLGCCLYVMLMATYPFRSQSRDTIPARQAGEVLKYPKWKTLSANAQDLIVCLCRDRLPVDEAQKHPWVTECLNPCPES
jgi:tRNA A-37 threonylcarbamoyl transferase component Bud32